MKKIRFQITQDLPMLITITTATKRTPSASSTCLLTCLTAPSGADDGQNAQPRKLEIIADGGNDFVA